MNLTLKDFMEKVPLKDPTKAKRFLVFVNDDGEELQVPVGPDAIEAIVRFVHKPVEEAPESTDIPEEGFNVQGFDEQEPEPTDATTFGGDVEEGDDDPDGEDPLVRFELPPPTNVPESEDKIPSL